MIIPTSIGSRFDDHRRRRGLRFPVLGDRGKGSGKVKVVAEFGLGGAGEDTEFELESDAFLRITAGWSVTMS